MLDLWIKILDALKNKYTRYQK